MAGEAADVLIQAPGIEAREIDDETFLIDPAGNSIHTLNAVGSAIWRCFAQPANRDEIASLLAAAFPDTGAGTVRADAGAVIAGLVEQGLLRRAG